MFRGTISITTDLEFAKNCIPTHRIFMLSPVDELIQYGGNMMNILLPPYSAMMSYSNNNMPEFYNSYFNYLNNRECGLSFCVLFKLLLQGSNVLIYFTRDEYEMLFGCIDEFMVNRFGIHIASPRTNFNFSYSEQHLYIIYSLLYLYEFITIEELFKLYPQGMRFDADVTMKLISEMRPPINVNSIQEYEQYFYDYKESVKQTNKYVPNLFTKRV